jgi:hypothetical protein
VTSQPTITTKPLTDRTGHLVGVVASIQGDGDATVALPASVGVPAIVHAQYNGAGKFVVAAGDAHGHFLSIAAQSFGNYDGTFPVGFVDQHNAPTGSLNVAAAGAWRLDVTEARFAPRLAGAGVNGVGDAVMSYTGRPVPALVDYPGTSTFTIQTFCSCAHGVVDVLANAVGPYQRLITLPAGPAFISVTAAGDWSMKLR